MFPEPLDQFEYMIPISMCHSFCSLAKYSGYIKPTIFSQIIHLLYKLIFVQISLLLKYNIFSISNIYLKYYLHLHVMGKAHGEVRADFGHYCWCWLELKIISEW